MVRRGIFRAMGIVEVVLTSLLAYAIAGIAFAIVFLRIGIASIDPAARGSGFWFRLFVLPGTVALWPVMLTKWIFRRRTRPA